MRKSTVNLGLKCALTGVVLVTIATFFHNQIADLFFLAGESAARFVFLGLFWGGLLGGVGVLLVAIGLLRGPSTEQKVRLTPTVVMLLAVMILFFLLFISFFHSMEPEPVDPGTTINI